MNILAKIAFTFRKNVTSVKDLESRSEIVRSILSDKKALLIFDDVESSSQLRHLLPAKTKSCIIITSRNSAMEILTDAHSIRLDCFTLEETFQFFQTKLGKTWFDNNELPRLKPWYPQATPAASSKSFDSSLPRRQAGTGKPVVFSNDYKMDIERIGKVLGFLPLALNIILTKIRQGKNESVSELTKILEREKSRLELLACEEISIRSSFEISFTTLDEKLKRLFESLAVFSGEDFSQEAASFVNKLDSIICHELLNQLCGKSLLDYSQSGRFFLHPLLKVFAKEKIMTREPYLLAAQYYTDFLEKRVRQKQFANYELLNQELDNMIAICDWTFENKEQDLFLGLWKNISRFIAEVGLWDELERLGLLVYRCSDLPKYQDIKADCCINVLSWINFWKGNLEKAKGWAREGYEIAQRTKNLHLRSLAQNRLAFIFDREGNVGEAGELIDLSLEGLKKVNDLSQIAETLRYLTYIPHIKPFHSPKL